MTYVVFFARGTLFVVFTAALLVKLQSRSAWSAFVVATGSLLGVGRAREAWACFVVLIEASTAACLSVNETVYAGLVLALVALTVFLVVVVSGVIRGVRTACNCFGSDGNPLSWAHVCRNVMLVSVAALGVGAATISKVPSVFAGATYATPIVLGLITAALFVMWDDFTYLVSGRGAK